MKIRTFVIFAMALSAFMACEPKAEPAELSLSVESLDFAPEGEEKTLDITSNSEWMISTMSGEWFSVSQIKGTGNATITITAEENVSKQRVGSVKFISSDFSVSVELPLTQAAPAENPNLPDTIFEEKFAESIGKFTIVDKTKPAELEAIWTFDAKYGMKATGYSSANSKNYDSESWLISPEIDLTNRVAANLTFEQAGNFFDEGKVKEQCLVKVTADGGETWENVEVPTHHKGNSWTFAASGNIDLGARYKGKKIKIAFVYKSTATKAGTWEIKNVLVSRNAAAAPDEADKGNTYNGVPVWMELPEVTNEKTFHIHALMEGGKRIRNYSMNYDEKHLVATWTAYPLCDWYRGSAERSDKWVENPFVENQAVMAKAGDWYNPNGYERGHQIASADRNRSAAFNLQTFYYTNAAPMLKQSQFNSGVWGTLENKVRDWSKASAGTDTLYVVTGAIAKDGGKTVKDNNGKPCTVPEAYYKALLRYDKDGKTNKGYIAVGFYLEHKDYSKESPELSSFAMSLKELEEKTGLKFFVNLEDKVGTDVVKTIKSQGFTDNNFWK